MCISETTYMNEKGFALENQYLRCIILPQFGGKAVSIKHRDMDFELLFQNPKGKFRRAERGSSFSDFEACGFDDAFPNIDEEIVDVDDLKILYPDHGEIWTKSFTWDVEENSLLLRTEGDVLPYIYQKRYSVCDDKLICSYSIEHKGDFSFPYIWAMHFLANYEEDMRFIFPKDVSEIEVLMSKRLENKEGEIIPFKNDCISFEEAPTVRGIMEKYYVKGKVTEGICGYYYPRERLMAQISYDADKLPYLGLWITTGGYRGDSNCAFEPTNAYYDSIGKARSNNAIAILAPGDKFEFDIDIKLFEL